MSRPSKDEGMASRLSLSLGGPRPGAVVLDVEKMDVEGDSSHYPNSWFRFRLAIREYVAEFLGVCILVIFGAGVDCQVVLASNTAVSASEKGSWLSLNLGWAVGTALGVWVSGGISGGHVNPAVTLMLATFRGFPWSKVPGYILAQLLGGVTGAALAYFNYIHAIDIFEGGRHVRTMATAGLFSTYAADYMTSVSAFFSEFLATAVLCIMVLAINDKSNTPPPPGLAPLVIFFILLGIGASLGMETGYAINPARDLGPRILTAMVGYGRQVFTFRDQYWIWCPVLGPILGAQAAAVFYDLFLYTGEDSPFNRPSTKTRRKREQDVEAQSIPSIRRRSGRDSAPVFHLTVPNDLP